MDLPSPALPSLQSPSNYGHSSYPSFSPVSRNPTSTTSFSKSGATDAMQTSRRNPISPAGIANASPYNAPLTPRLPTPKLDIPGSSMSSAASDDHTGESSYSDNSRAAAAEDEAGTEDSRPRKKQKTGDKDSKEGDEEVRALFAFRDALYEHVQKLARSALESRSAGKPALGNPLMNSITSAEGCHKFLADYKSKVSQMDIKQLAKEALTYRYQCSTHVILVPNWHTLRDELWNHLTALGIKKAKRSVSTKKDLIEICIQPNIQFDFSEYVKEQTSAGSRRMKASATSKAKKAFAKAEAARSRLEALEKAAAQMEDDSGLSMNGSVSSAPTTNGHDHSSSHSHNNSSNNGNGNNHSDGYNSATRSQTHTGRGITVSGSRLNGSSSHSSSSHKGGLTMKPRENHHDSRDSRLYAPQPMQSSNIIHMPPDVSFQMTLPRIPSPLKLRSPTHTPTPTSPGGANSLNPSRNTAFQPASPRYQSGSHGQVSHLSTQSSQRPLSVDELIHQVLALRTQELQRFHMWYSGFIGSLNFGNMSMASSAPPSMMNSMTMNNSSSSNGLALQQQQPNLGQLTLASSQPSQMQPMQMQGSSSAPLIPVPLSPYGPRGLSSSGGPGGYLGLNAPGQHSELDVPELLNALLRASQRDPAQLAHLAAMAKHGNFNTAGLIQALGRGAPGQTMPMFPGRQIQIPMRSHGSMHHNNYQPSFPHSPRTPPRTPPAFDLGMTESIPYQPQYLLPEPNADSPTDEQNGQGGNNNNSNSKSSNSNGNNRNNSNNGSNSGGNGNSQHHQQHQNGIQNGLISSISMTPLVDDPNNSTSSSSFGGLHHTSLPIVSGGIVTMPVDTGNSSSGETPTPTAHPVSLSPSPLDISVASPGLAPVVSHGSNSSSANGNHHQHQQHHQQPRMMEVDSRMPMQHGQQTVSEPSVVTHPQSLLPGALPMPSPAGQLMHTPNLNVTQSQSQTQVGQAQQQQQVVPQIQLPYNANNSRKRPRDSDAPVVAPWSHAQAQNAMDMIKAMQRHLDDMETKQTTANGPTISQSQSQPMLTDGTASASTEMQIDSQSGEPSRQQPQRDQQPQETILSVVSGKTPRLQSLSSSNPTAISLPPLTLTQQANVNNLNLSSSSSKLPHMNGVHHHHPTLSSVTKLAAASR